MNSETGTHVSAPAATITPTTPPAPIAPAPVAATAPAAPKPTVPPVFKFRKQGKAPRNSAPTAK